MKKISVMSTAILAATALATTAFAETAAKKPTEVKVPVMMTDAQMAKVVAGNIDVGPGFGICTATFFAHAQGAIKTFSYITANLPGNGHIPANGNPAGFGNWTAGRKDPSCGLPP
jgi:hypothetical protein